MAMNINKLINDLSTRGNVKFEVKEQTGCNGQYFPKSNKVSVAPNCTEEVLLHECLHAVIHTTGLNSGLNWVEEEYVVGTILYHYGYTDMFSLKRAMLYGKAYRNGYGMINLSIDFNKANSIVKKIEAAFVAVGIV